MKKTWYKKLLPLVMALCLFVCIRLVTDVPMNRFYWEGNTWAFMLKEITGVVAVCYSFIWLEKWLKWNRRRKNPLWLEYGGLFLLVGMVCWGTVHVLWLWNDRTPTLQDFVIPEVLSLLFVTVCYTFGRSRLVEEEYARQTLQLERMKNDRLQTELKLLKAQYHPHFLFNALNTVYFQIDERNSAPRHTIEMLSDLLRYQLYGDCGKVKVCDEVDYLKRYIGLWKLRRSERLRLQVHFDETLQEQEIFPLLFVPLVENAFKYVGGTPRFIRLDMRLVEDTLRFHIVNSRNNEATAVCKPGMGIENLRRRLALLYPSSACLRIDESERTFDVELTIKL